MAGNVKNMGLASLDDLFKSEQERQQDTHERILNIPVGEIYPYARQPYSIKRPTPDLVRLMDSIEQVGVAEPLIVRPRTEGGYEIISGHRRDYCARTVGLESLPVIIREYTDDEADILVVDYNITREDLLPSEKARAYSLKLEAMKRQAGRPSKENGGQVGLHFIRGKSKDILAEQVGESATQIQRYVNLTKLIPPLLEQVDNGILKVTPAADYISHLSEKEQTALLVIMERDEVSPSLGQAKRLMIEPQRNNPGRHERRMKSMTEELTYTQIGEYLYPDLTLPETEEAPMGKYGMLHKTYLKEHKPMLYDRLLLAGKLDGHLMDIDRRATEMVEQLTRELAQQNRVDEEMKATNQMAWVQAMNNFKASAEEVVLRQLIYS